MCLHTLHCMLSFSGERAFSGIFQRIVVTIHSEGGWLPANGRSPCNPASTTILRLDSHKQTALTILRHQPLCGNCRGFSLANCSRTFLCAHSCKHSSLVQSLARSPSHSLALHFHLNINIASPPRLSSIRYCVIALDNERLELDRASTSYAQLTPPHWSSWFE